MIASSVPSPAAMNEYVTSLECGAENKAAQIRPWLEVADGDIVVDVGTGAGGVAAALARSLPDATFVGTDISRAAVESARTRHAACPRLRFVHGAASEAVTENAVAVIMGAVLHEVFSDGGDAMEPVRRALVSAYRMLAPGGRLVIRDFVRPVDSSQHVVLEHRHQDMRPGRTFSDFVADAPRPIPLGRMIERADCTLYETTLGACYEFLFRKDADAIWEHELDEQYGFWTADDAIRLVTGAGFQVLAAFEIPHRWVIRHRFRNRIRVLSAETGISLSLPAHQLFLVAERAS